MLPPQSQEPQAEPRHIWLPVCSHLPSLLVSNASGKPGLCCGSPTHTQ